MAFARNGNSLDRTSGPKRMRVADRLDLLSLLALLWIAFVFLMAVLVAIVLVKELVDPSEPAPSEGPYFEPYYIGEPSIVDLALWGVIIGIWFGSWGLISVAAIGRGTSIFGGHLQTTTWDAVIFIVGSLGWNIALAVALLQSVGAFLTVMAVLPAAVLIGVTVLLRRFFTGGLQSMTLGIIQRGPGRSAP